MRAGLLVFVDVDVFFVVPDGVLRVGNGALDERLDNVRADLLGFNGAFVVVADRFLFGVLVNFEVAVVVDVLLLLVVVVEDVIIMLFLLVDEDWLFFVVATAVVLLIRGIIFFLWLSSRPITLVAKIKRPVLGAQEK